MTERARTQAAAEDGGTVDGPLYPAITLQRKSGDEHLRSDGSQLSPVLGDFWAWAMSDLLDNTQRGAFAEFIVAAAVGASTDGVRVGWATYDLDTEDGIKVEVKSAAYLQSWGQKRPSRITFGIGPTQGWDTATGEWLPQSRRHADVYVFALLAEPDKTRVDPMDLDQWLFYVVPTRVLDDQLGSQRSISLTTLTTMSTARRWSQLGDEVRVAARGTPTGG